jgi:hypothetical protein
LARRSVINIIEVPKENLRNFDKSGVSTWLSFKQLFKIYVIVVVSVAKLIPAVSGQPWLCQGAVRLDCLVLCPSSARERISDYINGTIKCSLNEINVLMIDTPRYFYRRMHKPVKLTIPNFRNS